MNENTAYLHRLATTACNRLGGVRVVRVEETAELIQHDQQRVYFENDDKVLLPVNVTLSQLQGDGEEVIEYLVQAIEMCK